ncbi:hypothetical protein EPJ74_10920 [Brachyspira aalborgi]|uniref:DUF4382 domain-containing protein n=1 Tax=Brachyspira aalborgi TaxID=29522 RepID=A0A5C8GCD2_9SPIR|nr:hypothetical protein [Brachyspira aalborgi]TXJ59611.1 hypothetical protein EPJ74_10920 [Brachyspira aalborgi]
MSQKNKIFSITLSLLILASIGCRKSSTSPEPTSPNPTVFTVEAGTSSPIKIIKDTDFKAYADGNIGAKVGGTSDYSVTITKVEQKDTTVDVVLDASDFTVDKNTIKLSDAGIGKFSGKNLTEKQAKEYTLTLTYSTTANVEPKSREITTDIGIVQNHVVTKAEVKGIVGRAQKSTEGVSGSAGLIYLKPKEGSTQMNAITINMAGQDFQTTTPPDFKLTANNTDNNQFVADDALNIIGEALKNQTGYDTYFTDIKVIKKVIDTTSVDKATFYFQFILNKENAISDEIKNIVDETSGLSIEITLKGGGWE